MTDKTLSFDGMHSLQDEKGHPKKPPNPLLRQTRRAITAIASGEILQRFRRVPRRPSLKSLHRPLRTDEGWRLRCIKRINPADSI